MSRTYRVRISETLTKTIHVSDGVESSLPALINVLSEGEMNDELSNQLKNKGFKEDENGNLSKKIDNDIVIEVDPKTRKVKASISSTSDVHKDINLEDNIYDPTDKADEQELRAKAESKLREDAKDLGDKIVEEKKEEIRKKITSTLEKSLRDIQNELDQVVTETLKEALKKRASQLGEVQEVAETENGLTIKVKL